MKKNLVRNIVFIALAFVLAGGIAYMIWDANRTGKQETKKPTRLVPYLKGPDGIVARVGKIDITMDQYVEKMTQQRLFYINQQSKDIDDPTNIDLQKTVRSQVLENLTEEAVYKNFALEKNLDATESEINKAIADQVDTQATQAGGYDKLEKKLKDSGGKGIAELKEKMKADPEFVGFIIRNKVKDHIQKNIKITEKEARDFYESKLIGISRIVLYYDAKTNDEKTTKEGYETMNKLRDLIGTKATFEEMAKNFSEDAETAANGGKVADLFIKGALPSVVDEVVWKMKVGDVSKPILTSDSFWIVKLDFETYVWQYYFSDPKTKAKVPFETIKNKVGDQLITVRLLEEENKWFNQYRASLKSEVFIDYKEQEVEQK